MTTPISITEAHKLLSMAREDCERATPEWGEGWLERRHSRPDCAFIILSRAVLGPMVEYTQARLTYIHDTEPVAPADDLYPVLAALRDHYDKARPDWRKA